MTVKSEPLRYAFDAPLRNPTAQRQARRRSNLDALPFGRLWYIQVWHAIGYAEFRRRPLCDFQKKPCGSGGVRVGELSAHSEKAAKRGWHTDIDRRRLVWKF